MSNAQSSAKVAIPYAEALFESSKKMKLVDKTGKELAIIQSTVNEYDNLKNFLANPLIEINIKKNVLKSIFINQVDTHVLNFIFLLIEKHRIDLLPSILACYVNLVNQLELVTLVTIYTVVPLDNEQKQILQDKLRNLTKSKVVELIVDIKPELIGGFIIRIGSKVIDMSIYGQLNQISSHLNGAYL